MKHKTKSIISLFMALCLMLSLGVGALADLNVVDPPPENIPSVTFGDSNTLTNTDPSTDPGADDKENNGPSTDPEESGSYTITVNVTPADAGTVRVSGQGVTTEDGITKAEANTLVFLTVTADAGYTVTASSNDCDINGAWGVKNQFSFLMPEKDVTISVNLTSGEPEGGDVGEGEDDPSDTHTISVKINPPEGGKVTFDGKTLDGDGKTTATANETVYFTVEANEGYESGMMSSGTTFVLPDTSEAGRFYFTMPDSDLEITINFKSKQDAGGGDAGSGGNTDGSGASEATITIGVEPAGSGTVTVEDYNVVNGEFTAPVDEKIYFTVEAAPGYKFNKSFTLTGDMGTVNPEGAGRYSLYVPKTDSGITAIFEKDDTKYAINVAQDIAHGTVTTDPAGPTAGGTAVTLTATPVDGYELESISVTETDGTPVTVNGDQFIMPNSAVNVTATFTEEQPEQPEPPVTQTYSVTSNTGHFSISGLQGPYAEGARVSFTVTPDRGYYINSVSATGATVNGGNGSYYFTMPAGNVDITVDVRWNGWWPGYDHWHSIDASYDGDYGYVTVDSWAYVGNTVYFTVHPYYDSWHYWDYSVGVYTDGGVKLDVGHYAGDTWYFTMPNDDVTVYAWFDWYYGDYSVSKSVEGDGSIYVRSWADHGDKVWIDAVPQSGASLTSLNVYYKGGSWWYESLHGYYGRWYEVDVHYDSARGEYYFYMPAHDVVVEAVFTTVGESITVVKPDNGSLKLSTLRAEKGDLVYITVDPDKGYELSGLEVLSSLGKNVEVTELSENYYVFRMPGLNVKVKAEFRLSAYTPFADVSPNAWYFEAVSFVYDRGLMEGTSNYAFSPDADLSRGMLAAILYRMAGSPEVSGYSTFGDVPTTAYYARAIAWAQDHGIVTGVSAESYKPDSPVTREQLVAILSRYAQYKGYETSVSYDYLSTYGDASSASAYAREALNWAVARGVIDGQSGGVLAPTATASRAEVAQVLMNYLAVYA